MPALEEADDISYLLLFKLSILVSTIFILLSLVMEVRQVFMYVFVLCGHAPPRLAMCNVMLFAILAF